MAPKFGTSGLRGLVVELTPELIADHIRAFLAACPNGGAVHVGQDLRPSSPQIAEVVLQTVQDAGLTAVDCGALSTPALALGAMSAGHAAVMVTGSHIPADRNGLKFYLPGGEISKADETAILANLGLPRGVSDTGPREEAPNENAAYLARYVEAFGPEALRGMKVGVYEHSSVARDVLKAALSGLGADVVALARSETFIPVDTEAVDDQTRAQVKAWCAEHGLDALVSTDGDADRPMLADGQGTIVPGDVLGALSARLLGAKVLCTPVSSNSMIGEMPEFTDIRRTRIGSPFVIATMEEVLAADPAAAVVGYEANGGFLLGFTAQGPAGPLAPLMTRDCLLPLLATLSLAQSEGKSVADLVASLPARFTAADRIAGIPTERSKALIAELSDDPAARAAFFADQGAESGIDLTDGLRVSFASGAVVHLRPSGNAPEFRCYAEANSADAAWALVHSYLAKLAKALG